MKCDKRAHSAEEECRTAFSGWLCGLAGSKLRSQIVQMIRFLLLLLPAFKQTVTQKVIEFFDGEDLLSGLLRIVFYSPKLNFVVF